MHGPFAPRYHPAHAWPATATPRKHLLRFHHDMQVRNDPPPLRMLCTLLGQVKTVLTHYVRSTQLLRVRLSASIRVLTIAGACDRIIPAGNSATLTAAVGGHSVVLATGGHLLDGERPDDLAALVVGNMFSVAGARGAGCADAYWRQVVAGIPDARLTSAPPLCADCTPTARHNHANVCPECCGSAAVLDSLCRHRGPCLLHCLRPAAVGLATSAALAVLGRWAHGRGGPPSSGRVAAWLGAWVARLRRWLALACCVVGAWRAARCVAAVVRTRRRAAKDAPQIVPHLGMPVGAAASVLVYVAGFWWARRRGGGVVAAGG